MTFEAQLRDSIPQALRPDAEVSIASIRTLDTADGRVFMVSYGLEGQWKSPAKFTFPFPEAASLEESLAAFRDFNERSWASSSMPSLIVGRRASISAGAD